MAKKLLLGEEKAGIRVGRSLGVGWGGGWVGGGAGFKPNTMVFIQNPVNVHYSAW